MILFEVLAAILLLRSEPDLLVIIGIVITVVENILVVDSYASLV